MLSILIGLACIAIIVAFAEHLIVGLLWLGVAALALAGIALALVILGAVAPHLAEFINQDIPLLVALGIVAGLAAVIWKRCGAWLAETILRVVRSIVPKSWSGLGAVKIGWALLLICLVVFANAAGMGLPSSVSYLFLIGVWVGLALLILGGWWDYLEEKTASGFAVALGSAILVIIAVTFSLMGFVAPSWLQVTASGGAVRGVLFGGLMFVSILLMLIGAGFIPLDRVTRPKELRTQDADGNSAS